MRPIESHPNAGPPDGSHIFDVWSRCQMQLEVGAADSEVQVFAERINLQAESKFADCVVVALCGAFNVLPSKFSKHLVMSPWAAAQHGTTGRRPSKVGLRVSADVDERQRRELRDFYDKQLRDHSEEVVRLAEVAVAPDILQFELNFNSAPLATTDLSTVPPVQRPQQPTTGNLAPSPDSGAAARASLARELAAHFEGKSFDFELATEAGDVVPCSGRLGVARSQPVSDDNRTLFGSINELSKQPAQIQIHASESCSRSRTRTWVVGYEYTDEMVAKLSALFAIRGAVSIEFEIKCFGTRSVVGDSVLFELTDCRLVPVTRDPAANESPDGTEPQTGNTSRHAA